MNTDKMEANRKYWNNQHLLLRRFLVKDKDHRKAIETFLGHHAMVHTAKLYPGGPWSFQDQVLSGLTDAQMRYIPKSGSHSVAWMIWHIARIEDVTMNVLLADSPEVLRSGNWLNRLGITCVDVGNEMPIEEMVALSETINLKALLAYRLAVGKRTRQLVRHIKPDELWGSPAPERLKRIAEDGAVRHKAAWLLDYWGGHPNTNLLLMPATRHCFVHLNEVGRMLPKLRRLQIS